MVIYYEMSYLKSTYTYCCLLKLLYMQNMSHNLLLILFLFIADR